MLDTYWVNNKKIFSGRRIILHHLFNWWARKLECRCYEEIEWSHCLEKGLALSHHNYLLYWVFIISWCEAFKCTSLEWVRTWKFCVYWHKYPRIRLSKTLVKLKLFWKMILKTTHKLKTRKLILNLKTMKIMMKMLITGKQSNIMLLLF